MYAQFGDYALKYLHDEKLAGQMFVAAVEANPDDREYAERIIGNLLMEGHGKQAEQVTRKLEELDSAR